MATIYHFKTNTLLKNLVGKDLINDDNIAIIELAKNSYDASSPVVSITFEDLSSSGRTHDRSRIVIEDHGTGMSLQDIRDKWLNIAYSEKKQLRQENGAYYAGNKGVGRFSCDRLGAHLDLLTRVDGGRVLHMPVDWTDFEIEGKKDLLIQDIDISIGRIEDERAAEISGIKRFPKKGTILVISELRSVWGRDRLLELKRSLEKFLNPNQLFQRNAFKITLNVPDLLQKDVGEPYYNAVNGEVRNQVFEKLKFNATYIHSHVSAEEGVVNTELYHEGELVFRLKELASPYPELGDVSAIIYYLNPYKKAYFTRQTGIRSVDFGSIFLFLNGFRVAPYGDRGDDWLGLDVRKTQGTTRYLSSRDIVGRIEISDGQESFQPVSSREGLKNTPAFLELKEAFFLETLRKLERFVVDGLDWDSVPQSLREELRKSDGLDWDNTPEIYVESRERKQQRIALSIMSLIGSDPIRTISYWFNPSLLEAVYETRSEEVRQLLSQIEGSPADQLDGDLKKGLVRIRKLLQKREEEAKAAKAEVAELKVVTAKQQQVVEKLRGETETYRAQTLFLQSVTQVDVNDLVAFHHQINHDSTIVANNLAKGIKALRAMPNSRHVIEFIEKALMANRRISVVAQYASKANFRSGIKKELTDIPAFIQQYLLNIAKDFTATDLNVRVNNLVNEAFEIKASKLELSIFIDNLLSNSVKAMSRRLDVEMKLEGRNHLRVSFKDDGRGLSPEIADVESIFEMGVTTSTGSGLGLFHARRIVESMDGRLTAIPQKPKGMEMLLELTR